MNLDWQRERYFDAEHSEFVFWLALRNLRDPTSVDFLDLEQLKTVEECQAKIKEAEIQHGYWIEFLSHGGYSAQLEKAKIDLLNKRIFDINSQESFHRISKSPPPSPHNPAQASTSTSASTSAAPSSPLSPPEVVPYFLEQPNKRRKIVWLGESEWRRWVLDE